LYNQRPKTVSVDSPLLKLIDKNSNKITERIRHKRYEQIFNSLKPESGKIHYELIDCKDIDEEILEILSRVIENLEEKKEGIDFKQFCEAMDGYFKVLTPQEKWNIMFVNKNKEENLVTEASNN
jgi:hypothetical protein